MQPTIRIERRRNSDSLMARLRNALRGQRGRSQVKVGFPAGRVPGDIIERAIYNEFGTTRIPERPFMRNAMIDNRGKYEALMRADGARILKGQLTVEGALNRLGLMAVGDIKDSIGSNVPPPNAPSTVARKGSSRTLIDTGNMRQAVTFVVED